MMMKRCIAFIFAALLMLGIAGCGAAEPQPTGIVDAATPMPTPTATPASGPVACLAIDAADLLEAEAGSPNYHDFDYKGNKRKYLLYIPEDTPEGAPLVFVLHGYYGQAYTFMNKTGMNAVADKHGFGVVYPQGLPGQSGQFPGSHWNADFTFSEEADVGFLTALAAHLQNTYGFSGSQTFAAGLSNGGFMCYTLAVKAPGAFRAIASVAGTMSKGTWDDRDFSPDPVPVLQVHGTADATVPIDGTMMLDGGWGGAPEMEEIIRYWADRDGTDSMTGEASGHIHARLYASSDSDCLVWYYLIDGFDHDWPNIENAGLDTGALIWAFFSKYLE